MRVGDFGVEVVPRGDRGLVREVDSGHVLARPGQVYALRLRNFGPLRCVADVSIDGHVVTAGGLVLEPWTSEELERPISPDEHGCFTVVAEGDERVFGPDGGRDNGDLGLIEVRFRRELPGSHDRPRPLPPSLFETLDRTPGMPPRFVEPPPSISPRVGPPPRVGRIDAIARPWTMPVEPPSSEFDFEDVERAAGTGLTGRSAQRFRATEIGPLETEATVIRLRIVIGSEESMMQARPLGEAPGSPTRPAARP